MTNGLQLSGLYILNTIAVFGVIAVIALGFLRTYHPFAKFGPANMVTTVRAAIVALVAGLIGEPNVAANAVFAAAASTIAIALDGVDGWLARRTGMVSAFGARFDMEVDALLILVLSILAWQYEKAGAWIVTAGLLRYLFVAAGWAFRWMRRPLPPSRRRQAVCVLQVIGSIVVVLPTVVPPTSTSIAALLLFVLSASFFADVLWLWDRRSAIAGAGSEAPGAAAAAAASAKPAGAPSARRDGGPVSGWLSLAVTLLLLNASLTFKNIWPTPAVSWKGDVSIELAITVLAFAILWWMWRRPQRPLRNTVTVFWLLLILGRYVDVTAPALWGRTINFYWDLQFVPDVAVMLAQAASPWLVATTFAAVVAILILLYALLGLALDRLWTAMEQRSQRRGVTFVAAALVLLFAAQRLNASAPTVPAFPTAVTATYARQVEFVVAALRGSQQLPPGPSFDDDLSRVKGADVLLLFLESYGAVVYERPDFSAPLTPSRDALEIAIHESGHSVVSAFVESPTFGGSSWFAHLSLLSGLEVSDPETNALLMTEHRATLPTAFARRGYRTIAIMPGLWYSWPEGAFYGFEDIYNGRRLDYRGPPFGWWSLTDQFTLARLDESETRRRRRPPLFVFLPTVSTHTPFAPTPPYQPDWKRMLTDRPYDMGDLGKAYSVGPDWLNLGPSYVASVSYAYETLAGYLRQHAKQDFVMILIGDHQPPALVSGPGTPWDVPVHVITNRRVILDRLVTEGFQTGLTPKRPSLGKMHMLTPLLLDAFSSARVE